MLSESVFCFTSFNLKYVKYAIFKKVITTERAVQKKSHGPLQKMKQRDSERSLFLLKSLGSNDRDMEENLIKKIFAFAVYQYYSVFFINGP